MPLGKVKFYHKRDIIKAFNDYLDAQPKRLYYSLENIKKECENVLAGKEHKRSFVYNIDIIIKLLENYIEKNKNTLSLLGYKESRVCKIIGVKKLTMHNLRTKGLIGYRKYPSSNIYYSLGELLDDFKEIRRLKE